MTSIAIYQPNFIPWLNFFRRLNKVDKFVFLDHVNFQKNGLQNRNKIIVNNKETWLTIPVKKELNIKISNIKISYERDWRSKHLNTIHQSYCKSEYFKDYFKKIEQIYNNKKVYLIDFNLEFIKFINSELNIKTPIALSSELNINDRSTDMIIKICKLMKADLYISGYGSLNYLQPNKFKENKIKLEFDDTKESLQNYDHLSILHLLFSNSKEDLKKMINYE
jgi:hypothetical protein